MCTNTHTRACHMYTAPSPNKTHFKSIVPLREELDMRFVLKLRRSWSMGKELIYQGYRYIIY